MNSLHRAFGCALLVSTLAFGMPARAEVRIADPLLFFAGVTETVGTTKVMMHKPVQTRSLGRGRIEPDGSLKLLQRVQDEGQAAYLRTWDIHRVAPGRFAGTMSQAIGPVLIEQVGNRFKFSFRMKGDLSVEQWLTPLPGGVSANSDMTVRKFGFTVATSRAVVRKLS